MGRKNVIIDREVQKWSLLTPEQNKEVRIMNKKIFCILTLLLVMLLSVECCSCVLAEGEIELEFRSMPGYTCYPLVANETYRGKFFVDCPAEWQHADCSYAFGCPVMIAGKEFEELSDAVMIGQFDAYDKTMIIQDEDHPLYSMLMEGYSVIAGEDTEYSKIIEKFDIHGLPATRVEMIDQGYEMVWIQDPEFTFISEGLGTYWFIMYPTHPDDKEYTGIIEEMIDSFTVSFPVSIETAPETDFSYVIEDDEVRLTSYIGKSDYVVVPSEIEGKPVTSMGNNVFYETSVRCVSLPDSVRDMGPHTFGGCTKLVYVKMPKSLETLPMATFESCFRLVDPGLNEGLKKIEYTAFWGNMYLTELHLPETLEEIDDNAFVLCDYLGYISVPEQNGHFVGNEDETIVFSADGEKLIWYSYMNEEKEYTVPAGVKQIYSHAFAGSALTSITLPEGLEYIGNGAFTNSSITELHIPESTTEIGIMQNVRTGEESELTTAQFVSLGDQIQTIYGVPGSAAEKYAEINKLTFIPESN